VPPADALQQSIHLCIKTVRLFVGAALGATCRCIAAVHPFVYQNCPSICGGCLGCLLQMYCRISSICVSKLSVYLWGLPWVPPADVLPHFIHLCIKTVHPFETWSDPLAMIESPSYNTLPSTMPCCSAFTDIVIQKWGWPEP